MPRSRILSALLWLVVAGCGSEQGSQPGTGLSREELPGVYSGTFPCDGCAGIPTTLWLRSDGRYFFRQSYPSDTTSTASDVYSLGRWTLGAGHDGVELKGRGPVRAFSRLGRDVLIMRTSSDKEHRLTRDPDAPAFSAAMRLAGMTQRTGNEVLFTECLTGLAAPINRDGDFQRLRHQVRSVGQGSEPVYVELEGRFTWASDGSPRSVQVQRFITARADATC
jgi:hypothetical protein